MRSLRWLILGAVVAASVSVAGCSGGSGVEEGMPKNIDMTKDYTPAAGTPLISKPGEGPKKGVPSKTEKKAP